MVTVSLLPGCSHPAGHCPQPTGCCGDLQSLQAVGFRGTQNMTRTGASPHSWHASLQACKYHSWQCPVTPQSAACKAAQTLHGLTVFLYSLEKPLSSTTGLWGAVNSVLAIGGVGGLAVGLAGREILENLFTGLIILSSSPFEVGEEINFTSSSSRVGPGAALASGP